ncbi:MAG: nucleoside-diphosphate kinase [Bacteroidetes bacterium GWF2_42_66]|nr:MAG: nucleoside-diphosphate kinase [Bacteroidetes bacterium GWA2_42_15]OFY02624.1 MAG: nucleoside-diphosphate kinase [Bacteroidetes bacterium GWE2_42_39]OFY41276.1 MAG: nucleoside-diphosphate kinase [Bacteroidetes bacterium GWF2_42_66]HBL75535.1 nucleoside-diphosphate kinase [Prolixibacteraceae bacterium]HCU60557.1 nucleoside-diphosphate kinase [Prolixibacteraceae bacterium]
MTGNRTLTMIKPEAVKKNFTGPILNKIAEAGFHIVAMKMTRLSKAQAEAFYAVHKGKDFYENLTDFMSSGPIVAAILEKENAIETYRKLIGSTDPKDAEEGTIRKLFAESKSYNAVHGSDSDENARIESDFFFSETERYS